MNASGMNKPNHVVAALAASWLVAGSVVYRAEPWKRALREGASTAHSVTQLPFQATCAPPVHSRNYLSSNGSHYAEPLQPSLTDDDAP